jgi:hypothetical protein
LEKLFRLAPIVVLPLILTHPCTAQTCNAAPHPETNSGYAYMREEMKALRWIRSALLESTKIQPPGAREDPQHVHKLIELHSTAEAVADRYNCAVSILQNFKDSKNEYIKESAETLLKALETTKNINEKLVSILDSIYDAKRSQDIDQAGIAKMLGKLKSIQQDMAGLSMTGTQESTFAVLKMQETGHNSRPIAFGITHDQRNTLRAEAESLAKNDGFSSYVDDCAEIILDDLAQDLPESSK